ncbi:MAG TPA: hypothetical protein VFG14_08005, partial [Chthoniobacteraceae bacterium]|nr:hypothetical protein [Chthoniobacteraceae bacterium]
MGAAPAGYRVGYLLQRQRPGVSRDRLRYQADPTVVAKGDLHRQRRGDCPRAIGRRRRPWKVDLLRPPDAGLVMKDRVLHRASTLLRMVTAKAV